MSLERKFLTSLGDNEENPKNTKGCTKLPQISIPPKQSRKQEMQTEKTVSEQLSNFYIVSVAYLFLQSAGGEPLNK